MPAQHSAAEDAANVKVVVRVRQFVQRGNWPGFIIQKTFLTFWLNRN
jgi:hypothetical protein